MADYGIRTIWVNEFDLSALRMKRLKVESTGVVPPGLDEVELGEDPDALAPADPPTPISEEITPEQELEALVRQMSATRDEQVYLRLVRQSISCADSLISRRQHALLLPLVESLAADAFGQSRGVNIAESARLGLEQLSVAEDFLKLPSRSGKQRQQPIQRGPVRYCPLCRPRGNLPGC